MKPPPFDYVRAESSDHVIELLEQFGDEAKIIAGGQSLMPLLNYRLARPSVLVDINDVPHLSNIEVDPATNSVRIGSLARHRKLETSGTLKQHFPLISEAAGWIAHPQIRTRGTLGGSLAHSDASAELPVVMLALDATVNVRSPRGERKLTVDELVVGHFVSSLASDELVVGVSIPLQPARTGMAFTEFARRHGDYAIGGAAAILSLDNSGVCARARITVMGGGPTTVRCESAESLLVGSLVSRGAIHAAAAEAVSHLHPSSNLHGDSDYRRRVIETMICRVLDAAATRAGKFS